MIIYLDYLFINELIFNYAIIFLTEKFATYRTRKNMRIVSALVATITGIIVFLFRFFKIRFLKIIISTIVLVINFRFENVYEYIKTTIVFYFVTFFVAGIAEYALENGFTLYIYLSVIIYVAWKLIVKLQSDFRLKEYKCTLKIPGIKKKLHALVDTGNELKTKFGEFVVVVSDDIDVSTVKYVAKRDVDFRTIWNKETLKGYLVENLEIAVDGNEEGVCQEILINKTRKYKSLNEEVVIVKSCVGLGEYDALIGVDLYEILKRRRENVYGNSIINKKKD